MQASDLPIGHALEHQHAHLTLAAGKLFPASSQAIDSSGSTAAGGNVNLNVSGAGNGVNLAGAIVTTGGNTTNSAAFKGGNVQISLSKTVGETLLRL
jgi:hypothetical protein